MGRIVSSPWADAERLPEALAIYKDGINVAAKRGDMMPLKEMQGRLTRLQVQA